MDVLNRLLGAIKKQYPSDAAFERALGLKSTTVDSWRRGKSKAYMKMLPQLASALGTSAAYLLGETSEPNPPIGITHTGEVIPMSRAEADKLLKIEKITNSLQDLDVADLKLVAAFIDMYKAQKK